MNNELLLQVGVGGIFAMLLIREVLTFLGPVLKNGRNGHTAKGSACDADCLRRVEAMLIDLYEWHNVRDPRGVLVWYAQFGNEELKDLLKTMTDNVGTQTEMLKELLRISQESQAQLAALSRRRSRPEGETG